MKLSIRTHVFASQVTLDHIARKVGVWDLKTYSEYHQTFSAFIDKG